MKSNVKYFIEVKSMQKPRDEDESLKLNKCYESVVNVDFGELLKNKISDFIKDAKEKFQSADKDLNAERKILVLDFEAGIDARLKVDFSDANLEKIFSPGFFQELERKNDITIWTRKYF